MKTANLIVFVCALLTSCYPISWDHNETEQDDNAAYVYECENDFSFVAKFDTDKVWLFFTDTTVSLKQVASASETFYHHGKYSFRSDAQLATLETDTTTYRKCKNNQAKAIWETAKLNGVDFRALGHEPEWILEIKEYNKIIFITEYGKRKFIFKSPHSIVDYYAKKSTYRTHSIAHALEILLEAKTCTDASSGEIYDTTVFVGMDGLGYHGCGKTLH